MHLVLFLKSLQETSRVVLRIEHCDGDDSVNTECRLVSDRRVHVFQTPDGGVGKRVATDPATWCKRGKLNIPNGFYNITVLLMARSRVVNCKMGYCRTSIEAREVSGKKSAAVKQGIIRDNDDLWTREHVGPSNQPPTFQISKQEQ